MTSTIPTVSSPGSASSTDRPSIVTGVDFGPVLAEIESATRIEHRPPVSRLSHQERATARSTERAEREPANEDPSPQVADRADRSATRDRGVAARDERGTDDRGGPTEGSGAGDRVRSSERHRDATDRSDGADADAPSSSSESDQAREVGTSDSTVGDVVPALVDEAALSAPVPMNSAQQVGTREPAKTASESDTVIADPANTVASGRRSGIQGSPAVPPQVVGPIDAASAPGPLVEGADAATVTNELTATVTNELTAAAPGAGARGAPASGPTGAPTGDRTMLISARADVPAAGPPLVEHADPTVGVDTPAAPGAGSQDPRTASAGTVHSTTRVGEGGVAIDADRASDGAAPVPGLDPAGPEPDASTVESRAARPAFDGAAVPPPSNGRAGAEAALAARAAVPAPAATGPSGEPARPTSASSEATNGPVVVDGARATTTSPGVTANTRGGDPTTVPRGVIDQRAADAIAQADLRRTATGDLRLGMDLSSEGLGGLRLEMVERQGLVSISMSAADDSTRDALGQRLGELRDALGEAGVDVGDLDVGGEQGRTAERGGDRADRGPRRTDDSSGTPGEETDATTGAGSDDLPDDGEDTLASGLAGDAGVDLRL